MPNLVSLNVFSNKLTPFVLPHILKFIKEFNRQNFTMEMTRRDLNPKEQKDFISKLQEAVNERNNLIQGKFRINYH